MPSYYFSCRCGKLVSTCLANLERTLSAAYLESALTMQFISSNTMQVEVVYFNNVPFALNCRTLFTEKRVSVKLVTLHIHQGNGEDDGY